MEEKKKSKKEQYPYVGRLKLLAEKRFLVLITEAKITEFKKFKSAHFSRLLLYKSEMK